MSRRWLRRLPAGDEGSMIPLIAVCVLLVIVMMLAVTTATSAFITQRDIQADCDGAAAAAASEVDSLRVVQDQASSAEDLPLSQRAAQAEIDSYRRDFYRNDPTLTMASVVRDDVLTVRCQRRVKLKFGTLFGKGDGVDRIAESEVLSPVTST